MIHSFCFIQTCHLVSDFYVKVAYNKSRRSIYYWGYCF
uniref:Uncharacterized protein n=1 Tax=Arundo donax TaxID=35708 RepID=A0A0A9GRT4_ARUDO